MNIKRTLTLPNVSERRHVHILNPAAGNKKFYDASLRVLQNQGDEIIESKIPGEIRTLVAELFTRDPLAHAIVYGGDGTVYETINGIMDSGMSETASFSVIPTGSGNDFSAYANNPDNFSKTDLYKIDIVKATCGDNLYHFANMMNIGFDCSVVKETYTLKKKPLLHGSTAYIAGVLKVLAEKKTMDVQLILSSCCNLANNQPISDVKFNKKILLTACANAQFCGGGFKAAPLASITDSLLDVLVINDVSRLKFFSLVGDYRKGSYISQNGEMRDKFNSVISYIKCKRYEISGAEYFCLDGEIFPTNGNSIKAEVLPGKIFFAAL